MIPILTYHGLAREKGIGDGRYTLTDKTFEAQMSYLVKNHFKTVSLKDFSGWLTGENLPGKSVVLTFDDGRKSDCTIALPILTQLGLQAAFFVNPGTVGKEGFMTVEDLQGLHEAGMEIGSHGLDHLFLTELDEETLTAQLIESKKRLGSLLFHEVNFFSIPRGRYTPGVLKKIKEAGYQLAFGSDIGFNDRDTNPFCLRRWAMKRPYTLDDFISIVEGHPKRGLVLDDVFKQTAYRLLGHTVYEKIRGMVVKERLK